MPNSDGDSTSLNTAAIYVLRNVTTWGSSVSTWSTNDLHVAIENSEIEFG